MYLATCGRKYIYSVDKMTKYTYLEQCVFKNSKVEFTRSKPKFKTADIASLKIARTRSTVDHAICTLNIDT